MPYPATVAQVVDHRVLRDAGQPRRHALDVAGVPPRAHQADQHVLHHVLGGQDDLARLVLAVHDGAVARSLVEPDDVRYGRLDRLALPPLLLGITAPAT